MNAPSDQTPASALPPPGASAQPTARSIPEMDALESLLRLAVGATALGADELLVRVRKWEEQVMYNPQRTALMPAETPAVRARYALIGLLFVATRTARNAAIDFANYSERQADGIYRTLDDFARTPLLGILARPFKAGVDAVLRTRDRELERWIRIGRVEERDGRRVAALGTEELINEIILRISENDKLKASISQLVQQQSLDMTGEVVDDLRQGTIDADNLLESVIWRLLGRKPRIALEAQVSARSESETATGDS